MGSSSRIPLRVTVVLCHRGPVAGKETVPLLRHLTRGTPVVEGHAVRRRDPSIGEEFYRDRWRHDREVRSTHGVNCTGSCSWNVFVRDGIISWETQATDYPQTPPGVPDHEPRGCPRGASFSWYVYSPGRVKYPYVRGALLTAWRELADEYPDPVLRWRAIQAAPDTVSRYKGERGRGGFLRASYDEAVDITTAAHVATIDQYGPDRVAAFTPLPAMSPVSYTSGSRYIALTGGAHISFYDWYADLPPASPQTFGEQTDVAEARDWWNSSYVLVWGSNVPVTRTPDAHFLAEARYKGLKVTVIAPDYAEHAKFADRWLPISPGADGALAMALGHVVLKEFHVEKQIPYFRKYCRKFTDFPFLVRLAEGPDGRMVVDRLVTESDLGARADKAEFRPVVWDRSAGRVVVPPGVMANKYGAIGDWNLDLGDVDPAMSVLDRNERADGAKEVLFPRFDTEPAGTIARGVPVMKIAGMTVTTVFDLMLAHYGVQRPELPGDWPADYDDAEHPYTPAWQEKLTGVSAQACITVAREFAESAAATNGRAMAIMGAGINHWFNSDTVYRAILTVLISTGTVGRNGGGMNHYVGQEAIRPFGGWVTLAHALDWQAPPRQCNGTAYFYTGSDQWRYEVWRPDDLKSPLADGFGGDSFQDCLHTANRLGWQVSYPTFNRNTLDLAAEAAAAGKDPATHVTDELASGSLEFAVSDPDDPANFPRILFSWRSNPLGGSGKGHEFFIRHLLGGKDNADAAEVPPEQRPRTVRWVEEAPRGKLDLLVSMDFRMTSTANFADVVFPAATWYEKYDLSCTDLHPFVHSFNKVIDPPWQARSDWDAFDAIATRFSELAGTHLGVRQDIVPVSIMHDSPAELGVAHGKVGEWVDGRPEPGRTAPRLVTVERDYPAVADKWRSLGPRIEDAGVAAKDYHCVPAAEVDRLRVRNDVMSVGAVHGRPRLRDDRDVAEAILALSGATNAEVAQQLWQDAGEVTGLDLSDLAPNRGRLTWDDVSRRPQHVMTSPDWTGDVRDSRAYTGYAINVEQGIPWRTLTGRISFLLDHQWMKEFGEVLPIFKPPLHMLERYPQVHGLPQDQVAVRCLTPHNKWSIHSEYQDDPLMLTLFRGGPTIWVSTQDAERVGLSDGDWAEVWNRNGVVSAVAAVSPRMPAGLIYVPHAIERQVQAPLTQRTGRRSGTENSLTRALLKPTHMIGGYGQLSYGFNYYGCTGSQRDEIAILTRRSQDVTF